MASNSIFTMRVIRCPACHARLPVQARASLVTCEYCDARVDIDRRATSPKPQPQRQAQWGPQPQAQPARHVAQPRYSGFAWGLVLVPLVLVIAGASASFFALSPSAPSPAPPAKAPTQVVASREQPRSEVVVASETPPAIADVAEPAADEPAADEPAADEPAPPSTPRIQPKRGTSSPKPKVPDGPVITVDQARTQLEPKVRACMQKAKAHHLLAYMGNKTMGPVKVLADTRTRVDGVKVALAKTTLGRCLDDAGRTVRTSAFRSNYVRLDVRNPGVPDPLGALPSKPDRKAVAAIIAAFDAQVKACGRKHGLEGHREVFRFSIDGPSGKVLSVHGILSKAFQACAKAIYKGASFAKVKQGAYDVQHTIVL